MFTSKDRLYVSLSWIKGEAKQNPEATVQSKRTDTKLMQVCIRLSIWCFKNTTPAFCSPFLLFATRGHSTHLGAALLPRRTTDTSDQLHPSATVWLACKPPQQVNKELTTGSMPKIWNTTATEVAISLAWFISPSFQCTLFLLLGSFLPLLFHKNSYLIIKPSSTIHFQFHTQTWITHSFQ